ncbi:NAD(P)H-dependent oxidoreductase [Neotabrizicola sp. VNH66]|uniref:NAD(P)H-dependent oxidoreductase n=1 Tax=Neotabrizicola sp. VNH66 TaxID=3400918 RepID=UPI003BFBACE0
MTRCLIVTAHPLRESLCHHLAEGVEAVARARGWTVTRRDLAQGFDPRLTAEERAGYYSGFAGGAGDEMAELAAAEVLVLVFPTWWFGFPAVLKGWFDRVWAPGLAYDHSPGFGPMIPRLSGLRHVVAVTTMGAPGWIDRLVMRRPLRRALRWGIVKPCAPAARLDWLALYRAESLSPDRLTAFQTRIQRAIARIG